MAVTGTSKWVCPECTYQNWSSCVSCMLCGSEKPLEFVPRTCSGKFRPHTQVTVAWPKAASSPSNYSSRGASYGPEIICPGYNYPTTSSRSDTHASRNSRHSSKEKWVCTTCTYANWSNANQCTVCQVPRGQIEPRSGEAKIPSRGESILDYASCVGAVGGAAYINTDEKVPVSGRDATVHPPKLKNCKNKQMSSNLDSRASKKWRCCSCTYENWPRATKCTMCQTPKKRTPSPPLGRDDSTHSSVNSRSHRHFPDNSSPINLHSHGSNSNEPVASCSHIEALSPSASNSRLNTYASDPTPEILLSSNLKSVSDEVRQIRNRLSGSDWLFLNACLGVVNDEAASVKAYLRQDGDRARQLTNDECLVLGERSMFTVGSTLVHLAVKLQRSEILSLLLTPASSEARKRLPSQSNPDLATSIREEVGLSLHQHKGDWPCYFLTQLTTFSLPADIQKLCSAVQKRVLDEIVDRDVEKELEEVSPIINWSSELMEDLESRLYPLWNRTAGDCLLDSALQATWGVVDRDATLRSAMADSLVDGASRFYERWKESEQRQSHAQGFSLDEEQLRQDWAAVVALADQKGKSLEQIHIFALAHILRRPVIVYGVKIVKNFRGENLGFANFEGVYLPLLWEASFCWKSPVALAYTRGHFSALVGMSSAQPSREGAWSNRSHDGHVTYLPLVDSEGRLLPIHFLTEEEIGCDKRLLNEYCECHMTRVGTLTVKQEVTCQQQSTLVTQLVDQWLDRFRRMDKRREAASCTYDSDS